MPDSGRAYFVINQKSGTALDLSGQDHRSVIGFHLQRSENQKWRFDQHQDGWTIQNLYDGKFLDVNVPNVEGDGVSIVAVSTNNPRKWEVRYDDQFGGWRFFYREQDGQISNQNIDLSDHGNPANNTPVTLWGTWPGQNQVWRLEDA
ncbi:carbohydrate-binding module family 13 protein [Thelephora terrestris]|uniref:Carbohydrate-binding module family 13 protein n=1 Tax=Thelephora terrestris TaxID=56493 RepID=A0A9P6H4H7_9AGAM|nr:carbohydrate-binding module family 13 protein [Thelephora terrestris]